MHTITKTIAVDRPDGSYLEITAEERIAHPSLSDGFSITGALWQKQGRLSGRARKRSGRDADVAGCIHEEIAAAVPGLEPVIAVHLADTSGLPMHAKANGWYFYSGQAAAYERAQITRGRDLGYSAHLLLTDHERAARALHIAPSQLPTDLVTKELFDAFVDGLAFTHRRQADRAREAIRSLTDGADLEHAA